MQAEEITRRARGIARYYASRVPGVSEDDLASEATLAQLQVVDRYDESCGSWSGYAHRVAYRAARDAMRFLYPVSGRRRSASTDLRGTRGVLFVEEHLASDGHTVEREVIVRQVRARVVELVGEDGADFALSTLTGEFKPAEVAADNDVDVVDVYTAENRIRRTLRDDYRLRKLWEAL